MQNTSRRPEWLCWLVTISSFILLIVVFSNHITDKIKLHEDAKQYRLMMKEQNGANNPNEKCPKLQRI